MPPSDRRLAYLRYLVRVFQAERDPGDGPAEWWEFNEFFAGNFRDGTLTTYNFQTPFSDEKVNAMWRSFAKGADFTLAMLHAEPKVPHAV